MTSIIAVGLALLLAQEAAPEQYRTPPPELAAIIDAPPTPSISSSPSGRMLLLGRPSGHLTIADLSQPEV
jgi:hypothetical protein